MNTEKRYSHFTITQGAKTPKQKWHTSISTRKHLISLWNWKTLDFFELGNGTLILLYFKVPNFPACSDTPQYHSNSPNLVCGTGKLIKFQNNSSNIGKWDIHSTIFQDPNLPPPSSTHKNIHIHTPAWNNTPAGSLISCIFNYMVESIWVQRHVNWICDSCNILGVTAL